MREKLLADWGAAEAARGELAAAHEGIGETAKAHAAALAEAAAREVALEIEKAKLEDNGEATRAELLGAREELGRQAAAFKQTQHECGTLRARDEVNRAQLQELGASAAQGRELGESANMSLLKVKEQQLRERQEAKQLAEEHSRLEKELHLSKAVCERVRAEAAAEHAGLLEAQAKLEIAEESLVALQRENKVLVAAVENTQLPYSAAADGAVDGRAPRRAVLCRMRRARGGGTDDACVCGERARGVSAWAVKSLTNLTTLP